MKDFDTPLSYGIVLGAGRRRYKLLRLQAFGLGCDNRFSILVGHSCMDSLQPFIHMQSDDFIEQLRLMNGLPVTVRLLAPPLHQFLPKGDAEIAEVAEASGRIIAKPIFEFPGGRRCHFTDPDGYELEVWSET